MADYSYVNAPGAASYSAPLIDFSNNGPLGNPVDAYFQGTQQAKTLQKQNAFSDGLPKNPDGTTNVNGMVDTLAKVGGVDYAQGLAPIMMQQQGAATNAAVLNGTNPNAPAQSQPAQPARPQTSAVGQQSSPIPQAPAVASAKTPTGGYTGGDNGTTSVASLVAQRMPEAQSGPVIASIAQKLGVDPNAPLNVNDPAVRQALVEGMRPQVGAQPPQAPQGPASPQGPMAPVQPAMGTPAAPSSAGADFTPQKAQAYEDAARKLDAQAAATGKFDPAGAQALTDRAKAYDARAKQIYDVIGEQQKATPEMKNAAASGATSPADMKRTEEADKDEVARYGKKFDAITKAGAESAVEIPKLEIAQQIMSNPDFYSGTGEKLSLAYKRILSSVDPGQANAAQPQEVFRKVVSDSVRSQIQSLAQSGAGRVMLAEVRIMEKAAANPDNTRASNMTLVEMNKRLHQTNVGLDELARNYKGGRLDPGYDNAARDYLKAHPMFSPQELKNPTLLAAPVAPGNISTPQAANEWAHKMGLQKGDPIRFPDGSIKYAP